MAAKALELGKGKLTGFETNEVARFWKAFTFIFGLIVVQGTELKT